MAKRKSKTQKYKKNQKRKINKVSTNNSIVKNIEKEIELPKIKENINQKKKYHANSQYNANKKNNNNKKKVLVNQKDVKYNVALNKNNNNHKNNINNKNNKNNNKVDYQKRNNEKGKELVNNKNVLYNIPLKQEQKTNERNKSNFKIELPKTKEEVKRKKKNIFIRLLIDIKNNRHVIFNAALIITYIILLIGLLKTNIFSKGTVIYLSCIIIFLSLIAISYNRYLSGKIFTVIICLFMAFGIYQMQYTYDFIRNLDSSSYEYKKYYVVTFDNSSNRSIYNINNKKVGLSTDNCINVERMLNTKLDVVNYIEYEDLNKMFDDFFNQNFRAIIVNENQYIYLQNKINDNSKNVKILYEFKANAHK